MVVCPGGQSAIATAFRALAVPGETILVESPTYVGAIAAARAAGLRIVPVASDADGVRPDLLGDALRRTGARVFYCQPAFANPHGATLAPDRREAVLDRVAAAGAFLVEDDWARDLAIGDAPPPLAAADRDGHVVYLRSLTKSAAPGLRIAAVGRAAPAGARLRAVRLVDDLFVSGPLQEAALDLVSSPAWRRHLRRLRAALRERRDALAAAVERHVPDLRVPASRPAGSTLGGAARRRRRRRGGRRGGGRGVVVYPGRPWFPADPPGPFLRLTFAAAPPETLDEGARRLALALRR